ncbi:MAG TPA: DUF4388 domain-containing protein [Actinomycetota bacterium]|nr:DUF4388 domain-containing protein [Actinomycetota bacterium]
MTALSGSLDVFALPDVLRLVAQNRVTGALHVNRDSGDGVIYFTNGTVQFADSSLTHDLLGQRLVGAKVLSQNQLLKVLDEQKRSGGALHELLIEKKLLNDETLNAHLREQAEEAIYSLLQWDVGSFNVEPGEELEQDIGMAVSVDNLLMESSRRLEEWEVIRRKIPAVEAVVVMAADPPDESSDINIKPDEWKLLVIVDGSRSVRDISLAAGRSEFDTCKVLYGLVTAGLVKVIGDYAPAEEEPSKEEKDPAPVKPDERRSERRVAAPNGKPTRAAEPVQESDEGAEAAHAEASISKEVLQRLIAGVRDL